MFSEKEIQEIRNYLIEVPDSSKIYLGADSHTFKRGGPLRTAVYTVVLVVHIESSKGCKIFGYSVAEKDYDAKLNKPIQRLMNEAYKVVELYSAVEDLILEYDIEIHLDVNPDQLHASHSVVSAAAGYVMGTCGIQPKIKPDAWAASYAADRVVRGKL